MKMRSSSKASIHRILATRLAIVGLIISLVLGVSVLLIERSKVGEVVLDRALQATVHFNTQDGYLYLSLLSTIYFFSGVSMIFRLKSPFGLGVSMPASFMIS